jgi:hypothetical protein
VANCAQQAIGIGTFGARVRSNLPPQIVVVRQQILENCPDGRADVRLFA